MFDLPGTLFVGCSHGGFGLVGQRSCHWFESGRCKGADWLRSTAVRFCAPQRGTAQSW